MSESACWSWRLGLRAMVYFPMSNGRSINEIGVESSPSKVVSNPVGRARAR